VDVFLHVRTSRRLFDTSRGLLERECSGGTSLFQAGTIQTEGVRSLAWNGDRLVDWAGGARSWDLDGTARRASHTIGYRFG
jgi:hypothetical protein